MDDLSSALKRLNNKADASGAELLDLIQERLADSHDVEEASRIEGEFTLGVIYKGNEYFVNVERA